MTGVSDPWFVSKANELCAAYGLDTISTGATIAFTMNCVQDSLALEGDFRPQFGSGEDLLECIHLISRREGLGELMARGSFRMAEVVGQGSEAYLAGSRQQELPFHDPRLKNITGLGYALSPTGADHMHNLIDNFANFPGSDVCKRLEEMGQEVPIPLFGITPEKVEAYGYEAAFKHVMDSAVICHFYPYEYHHLVEAFSAAGGWMDFTKDEVDQIGRRIITMARLFILREGSSAAEDRLAARSFYKLADGPIAGRVMPENELLSGLQTYYQHMGWDEEGRPHGKILSDLEIDHY
jgi:aldehyde:ferredoxin oxidoreductase